jgi:hypothetical protein
VKAGAGLRRPGSGSARSRGVALLRILLLVGAVLATPPSERPLSAQLPTAQNTPTQGTGPQSDLAALEDRYRHAREEYDEVWARYERTYSLSEQALEAVEFARRAGDSQQLERALANFQVSSAVVMEAQDAVQRAAETLRVAGQALLTGLAAREAELLDRLEVGVAQGEYQALTRELLEVRWRTIAVDAEGTGLEEEFALRPVRELTVNPRDGPQELQAKAGFMDEEAARYDEIIADLDRRIEETDRRVQQLRTREDQIADLQRFDSDFIPGGRLGPRNAPSQPREDSGPGDSGELPMAQLSLSEQLALYRAVRDYSLQQRDLALAQAELFRDTALERVP